MRHKMRHLGGTLVVGNTRGCVWGRYRLCQLVTSINVTLRHTLTSTTQLVPKQAGDETTVLTSPYPQGTLGEPAKDVC